MYESVHKRFEQTYAKISRSKRTAMDEAVVIKNASANHFRDIAKYFQRTALVENTEATHNDSAYLIRTEPKSSLRFLETYFHESKNETLEHQHHEKNEKLVVLF